MHNMEFLDIFGIFNDLNTVKKIGNLEEIVCQVAYETVFPHILTIYSCISSYIRKLFLIYDFAPDPFQITLYFPPPIFLNKSTEL